MNAFAQSSEMVMPTPTQRLGAALTMLLNNPDPNVVPPVPDLMFHAGEAAQSVYCEGALSASQYDRLCYLAKAAGCEVTLSAAHDHADPAALHVQVQGGNLGHLEAMVTQEPARRGRAYEAEALMHKATGLFWYWDGFCLTTPYPEQGHPAHDVLQGLVTKGVVGSPYGLSVLKGEVLGSKTDWLSIHDCDLVRLRLIGQEMQSQAASMGR